MYPVRYNAKFLNIIYTSLVFHEVIELERPCNHSAECDRPFFVLQPIYPVSSLSLHRPPFSLSLVSHSCDVIVLFNLWVGLWWKRKEETKTLGIKRLHFIYQNIQCHYYTTGVRSHVGDLPNVWTGRATSKRLSLHTLTQNKTANVRITYH